MKKLRGPFFTIIDGVFRAVLIYSFLISGLFIPQAQIQAAWPAKDTAADGGYGGGWTNNSTGGTNWSTWAPGPRTVSNLMFLGSSAVNGTPNIDVSGKAWGLIPTNAPWQTTVTRSFTNNETLGVGQVIAIDMGSGVTLPVAVGETNGIQFVDDAGNPVSDFYITATNGTPATGTAAAFLTDQINTDLYLPFELSENGFRVYFKLTSATDYTLTLSNALGQSPVGTVTRNGRLVAGSSLNVASVLLFSGGSRSITNFYNNMLIDCGTFPVVSITPPATICSNANVTFTGSAIYSNSWVVSSSCGAAIVGPTDGSTVVVNPGTCGSFQLTLINNLSGCTNFLTTTYATVGIPSTITSPATVCPNSTGNSASVPDAGVGATYTWTISGGGGVITAGSGTSAITFSVGAGGVVHLNCTITSGAGCSSGGAQDQQITVGTPDSTITAPLYACPSSVGNAASVPDAGAGVTYLWTITGGTITAGGGTKNITFTAAASGSVTLNCTIISGAGCSSGGSQNQSVTIGQPDSTITAPASVCASSTKNVASVPTAVGATYVWSNSGGGANAITAGNGTHSIQFTADAVLPALLNCTVSLPGCSSGGSQNISVPVTAVPDSTITPLLVGPICAGTTNSASVADAGVGATYTWTISKGTITAGAGTPEITFTAGASGSVVLNCKVTNSNGCSTGGSQGTTVAISALPVSTITAASSVLAGSIGNGASVPATAGATYSWTITGGTITAGAGTRAITFTAGGSGSVVLNSRVVVAATGCSSSGTQTISISGPNPTITVSPEVCANTFNNVASVANAGVGSTYSWTIAGGVILSSPLKSSITFETLATGPVTLNCTITDADGIIVGGAQNQTVVVDAAPPANITFSVPTSPPHNTYICTNSQGIAYASVPAANFGVTYTWTFDPGHATIVSTISNSVKFLVGIGGDVTGQVVVVDGNGCASSNGIAVLPMYLPMSFSPTNDTTNILFRAYVVAQPDLITGLIETNFTTQSQPYHIKVINTTGHKITLTNDLSGNSYAISIASNADSYAIVSTTCTNGNALAPKGTCDCVVQFTPQRYGTIGSALNVSYTADDLGHIKPVCDNKFVIDMTGAGKHPSNLAPLPPGISEPLPPSILAALPPNLNGYAVQTLGDVPLGFQGWQSITLTNQGNRTSVVPGDVTDIVFGTPIPGVANPDGLSNPNSLYITDDTSDLGSGGAFHIDANSAWHWDVQIPGAPNNGWGGTSAEIGQGTNCSVGIISNFLVGVTFDPPTNLPSGKYYAIVHMVGDFVNSNGANHELTFVAMAQATAPVITIVDPVPTNALYFPGASVNFSNGPERVVIQNTGDGPLRNLKFQIAGINSEDYYIISDSCDPSFVGPNSFTGESGTPLQPGDLCGVTIGFRPGTLGPRIANLIINGMATNTLPFPDPVEQIGPNGYAIPSPNYVFVPLVGNGTNGVPSIGFDKTTLNFPSTALGGTSAVQSITVTNGGNATLLISTNLYNVYNNGRGPNVFTGGTGTNDFTVTGTSCVGTPLTPTSLRPGASCAIQVAFNPTSTNGILNTYLEVMSNSGGSGTDAGNPEYTTSLIYLTGAATIGTLITPSPTNVDFPGQPVGISSAAQLVVVHNTGDLPLTLSSVSTTGTNGTDFTATMAGCTAVPPGGDCLVSVTFTPSALGARTGTLVLTGNATNSPVQIKLTGSGSTNGPSLALLPSTIAFANVNVGTTGPVQSVTVTNTGTSALIITNLELSVAGEFVVVSPNCLNTPIQPGEKCMVNVAFAPTNSGAQSSVVRIWNNTAVNPASVPVSGVGAASVIAAVPASVVFGNQPQGLTSTGQVVTVQNTGNAPLTLSSVTLVGGANSNFVATPTGCTAVPPGGSCSVTVVFTPSELGALATTLHLVGNANVPLDVPVSGAGVASTPSIGFSPELLPTFGNVSLTTTSAVQSVTVTNAGSAPLLISSVTMGGSDPTQFAVDSTCVGVSIAAGGTCIINVRFVPTSSGNKGANVLVTDNATGSPHSFPVKGSGIAPSVALIPSNVTFGSQPVGVASLAQLVLVRNTGDGPLNITGVTVLNSTNAADFSATLAGCANVPPGGDCLLSVTFTPGAVGPRSGTVVLNGNATNSPVQVAVSGTGVTSAPSIGAAPANVNFTPQTLGTTSVVQIVSVLNNGTAALIITNIDLSVTGEFLLGTNTCLNVPLAPGAQCFVSVVFVPTNSGAQSSVVRIWNNSAVNPASVPISGVGAAPMINPVPGILAFGNVPQGLTSTGQTIQVQNTGNAPLTLNNVAVTGPGSNNFFASPIGCTTVPPGGSCSVTVVFKPTALGVTNATLVLTGNADAPATVTLNGSGVASAPAIGFSPALFSTFDDTVLGLTSVVQSVVVTNSGTAALVITNVALAGANLGDFVLLPNSCQGASIAPGSTCAIGIQFAPTVSGNRSASVLVYDNATGNPHVLPLFGRGIAPVAMLVPNSLNFGTQTVGFASAPLLVQLFNIGDGPLTVANVSIVGTNAADFNILTNSSCLNSPIQPGYSCSVSVSYKPGSVADSSAVLVFNSTGTNQPQQVTLHGVGVVPTGAAIAIVAPSTLNFGSQLVGGTTVVQTVYVSNPGNTALTITSVQIGGLNPDDYLIITNGCGQLLPGQICEVFVGFQPLVAIARTATLLINSTATNGQQQVVLTGTGTSSVGVETLSATNLDFGIQTNSAASVQRSVTIGNSGNAALLIANATVTGGGAAAFSVLTTTCGFLSPGATCQITVGYTPPTVNGNQNASLQVVSSPGGTTNITLFAGRFFDSSGITNCPNATISISPTTLITMQPSVAFSQQLTAAGGNAPYVFTVSSGSLPGGVTLSTNGLLAGTVTAVGNFAFTIRATDRSGCAGVQGYSVSSMCPSLYLAPATLRSAVVGVAYSQPVALSGGTGPFVYAITAGSLPPGLAFNTSGYLAGTPTTTGTYIFTLHIADANGCYGDHVYTVAVNTSSGSGSTGGGTGGGSGSGGTGGSGGSGGNSGVDCSTSGLAITTGLLTNAQVGIAYSLQFTTTFNNGPIQYSLTAGALPAGLTLTPGGLLSGIPSGGSGSFTITVTDARSCTVSKSFNLTVSIGASVIVITAPTLQSVTVNVPVVQQVTASGGSGPITFAVVEGALPSGLALSPAGDLTGVATTPGLASFTIQAQDSQGHSARQSYTLTVAAPAAPAAPPVQPEQTDPVCALTVLPANMQNGTVGQAYSNNLSVTGGAGTTTYSVVPNAIPNGLTLNPTTGLLTGTPTIAGSYAFWVNVQNGTCETNKQYAITVNNSVTPVIPQTLTRGNKVLITNAAGIVTLKVSGRALVAVGQTDPATNRIGQVSVTSAGSSTVLTITVKKKDRNSDGLVEIGTIAADGDLSSVAGTPVNIVGGGLAIAGKLSSVTLNSLQHATIIAGTSIGAVTIQNYVDSWVRAPQINKVNLSNVTTNNGGLPFGIQAPAINAVTVKSLKKFKWKKTGAADQAAGDFHVQKQ